jgi:hypothetical protein
MWRLFSLLFGLFGRRAVAGSIYLVLNGKKEIEVRTGFTPKEVWIRPMEPKGTPVCLGDCDAFDVKVIPHGFILVADLATEMREVQWIALR